MEPNLEAGERDAGMLLRYVGLEEAIVHNEEAARCGVHWIDAETEVMKYIQNHGQ